MKNCGCCIWCYSTPKKIASRQAYWGTDYCNPVRGLADCRLCFSFDKAVSATGQCLFLGCSFLGTSAKSIGGSQWLLPLASSELCFFLSLAVWDYQNSHWKFFWEISPWLLSLLPCTASEFSKCLERNTSQVLGIVFCSFLLIWILASQVSNFCFSFLKRLPKFLLVFLPLNSISVEAFCLDPQLLTPHLV